MTAVRRILAVLALSSAAVLPADGPLPIHAPPLLVPDEVAGLDVAPEVGVRVDVDERGRPSHVEVLSIAPSTPFDDRFRAVVVETISSWRFAPATEKGAAVPGRLEWKVRFPTRSAPTPERIDLGPRLAGSDAESMRAFVLALPDAERRKILEREAREAVAQFGEGKVAEFATARFVVRTDAEDPKTAAVVGGNLEALYNILANDFFPGLELQPEPYKVLVFVYRTRASYEELQRRVTPFENSVGYYSPAGMIALHLEMFTAEWVLSTLLHEGTHAFLDRHVVRPGTPLPRWLGEGFAEYVGNSAIRKGKLEPGRTVVHKFTIEAGRALSVDTTAGLRLDDAKSALARGHGIAVDELLSAPPETFYGERRRTFYATAWLFVHFLRDGALPNVDASRAAFSRLLLYAAEGYPERDAFAALYGASDTADASFRRYVKSF